ncbi:MAG: heme biosynthesis protein HemY [Gammaproteobacteria bacterium]|nr:heme biosynthesis protein HemY [Gammaproteobacteria bacterium]
MKAGLAIALALALGALAGHFLLQDNGYVLLSFAGYVVEMSVPIATGLLVLAYLAIRLLAWLWRVPRQLGEATARARVRWAGRQATRGYIAIAEGKLDQGERLLTRGARRSGAPLMNYLAAARLAHQRNDPDRRDGWLRLAYEQEPAATDAVLLAQAEMQMDDQAFDQALATLNRIRGHNPKHAQALKLLAALHWRRQDWHALLDLVPALRAMPPLPPAKLNSWTTDAFEALLADPALDKAGLERLWDEVPKVLRGDPRLVLARAKALTRCGLAATAETEVRHALREGWDAGLIRFYGELALPETAQQLKNAEAFLRERPEDPDLLLTVGRLSFRNQLWGKARSYLETSLSVRPSAETCAALGQLLDRIGDREAAARAYQRGLALSIGGARTTELAPARSSG